MERFLREHIGRTVTAVLKRDGSTVRLRVLSTDVEGVSCNVLDHEDYDENAPYWFEYAEMADLGPD
jgi:hypothetical protein